MRARADQISAWLIDRGVKTIVIACNTATAAALTHLQTHLEAPIIGVMSSEAHAAVQTTRNRRVGLLATEATVRSGSYDRIILAMEILIILKTPWVMLRGLGR